MLRFVGQVVACYVVWRCCDYIYFNVIVPELRD
jgi:hypothetical protein